MEKKYTFTAKTVEDAKISGLRELGLSEEEVTIEVIKKGGLFSKATVEITVTEAEEAPAVVEEVPQTEKFERKERPQRQQKAKPEGGVNISEYIDTVVNSVKMEERVPRKKRSIDDFNSAIAKSEELLAEIIPYLDLEPSFVSRVEEDEIIIDVSTDSDPARLIGGRGDTIHALSELCRSVVNRDDGEYIRVTVDTADYRQRRAEKIADMARREARKAAKDRRTVELEAMNSYERRIVHAALADDKFVETESAGEGKYRHICIIPVQRKQSGDRKPSYNNNNRQGGGERRERDIYSEVPETAQQQKYDTPAPNGSYGSNSDFKKKGPSRMRTFGK
ncbi:MAG: Jag N-terminal domain-containing protein [Christensenellaceae bacterium]|jgi:spoIIIJ-associated protein|nr:Jag N-terminal domain-containing protein [Christensenellaceae bacterium]